MSREFCDLVSHLGDTTENAVIPAAHIPVSPPREGKSVASSDTSATNTCPICLSTIRKRVVLDNCVHTFCFDCIHEWGTRFCNNCPFCKTPFTSISYIDHKEDCLKTPLTPRTPRTKFTSAKEYSAASREARLRPVGCTCAMQEIPIATRTLPSTDPAVDAILDLIVCVHCGTGGNEELLMLCDGCDAGFHTYCLDPPLDAVPDGAWFCTMCSDAMRADDTRNTSTRTHTTRTQPRANRAPVARSRRRTSEGSRALDADRDSSSDDEPSRPAARASSRPTQRRRSAGITTSSSSACASAAGSRRVRGHDEEDDEEQGGTRRAMALQRVDAMERSVQSLLTAMQVLRQRPQAEAQLRLTSASPRSQLRAERSAALLVSATADGVVTRSRARESGAGLAALLAQDTTPVEALGEDVTLGSHQGRVRRQRAWFACGGASEEESGVEWGGNEEGEEEQGEDEEEEGESSTTGAEGSTEDRIMNVNLVASADRLRNVDRARTVGADTPEQSTEQDIEDGMQQGIDSAVREELDYEQMPNSLRNPHAYMSRQRDTMWWQRAQPTEDRWLHSARRWRSEFNDEPVLYDPVLAENARSLDGMRHYRATHLQDPYFDPYGMLDERFAPYLHRHYVGVAPTVAAKRAAAVEWAAASQWAAARERASHAYFHAVPGDGYPSAVREVREEEEEEASEDHSVYPGYTGVEDADEFENDDVDGDDRLEDNDGVDEDGDFAEGDLTAEDDVAMQDGESEGDGAAEGEVGATDDEETEADDMEWLSEARARVQRVDDATTDSDTESGDDVVGAVLYRKNQGLDGGKTESEDENSPIEVEDEDVGEEDAEEDGSDTEAQVVAVGDSPQASGGNKWSRRHGSLRKRVVPSYVVDVSSDDEETASRQQKRRRSLRAQTTRA